MANRQFVIFNIENEQFGIEIAQVSIIEKFLEIFKIPNTPDYIEGLINLRGKVHTVYNLRKRFNMTPKAFDENTKIIIVNASSSLAGLIVDSVQEIVRIDDDRIEAAPKALTGLKNRFISGIAKIDDKVVLLLNLDEVLAAEE